MTIAWVLRGKGEKQGQRRAFLRAGVSGTEGSDGAGVLEVESWGAFRYSCRDYGCTEGHSTDQDAGFALAF